MPVAGYGSHPVSRRGSRMPSRNPSYAVGSGKAAPHGGVQPQQVNKRLQAINDAEKAEDV